MKFENYNFTAEIHDNIDRQNFKRPTDIQFKAIPPILRGEDVLAVAQTGTGKTIAFVLPVLDILLRKKLKPTDNVVRCVVMVPTHELALQVREVFFEMAKGTGIRSLAIIGGTEQEPQINQLQKGVDVVVATPGRLFDLESQGHLDLKGVEILILDEADHMLELGFKNDMDHLIRKLPRKRQTLFFSATIDQHVKDLAYSLVNKPVRIQISPKDPVARNIEHSVVFVEMDDKRFFLERIVQEHPEAKILVFARTKVRTERVCKALERVAIQSETIHSDKDQKTRSQVMSRFKTGENKILIATDISARGIDIPNVELVVNYDLPEESENYVHRVGRTGRGTNKGLAVTFCSLEEKEKLQEIEEYLGKHIDVLIMARDEYTETIEMSKENPYNWQNLIAENEAELKKKRKKKSK